MTEQLSTGQHFSFRFHSLLLRNITLSVIVFCSCMFKLSLSWLDPSYQFLNTFQSFPFKKKKSLNPTFPLQLSSYHLIISFPLWHTFWTCDSYMLCSCSGCLLNLHLPFFPQKLILSWQQWVKLSSVQSLSRVRLFATPWTAARQASLFITISRSSVKLTSIESVKLMHVLKSTIFCF